LFGEQGGGVLAKLAQQEAHAVSVVGIHSGGHPWIALPLNGSAESALLNNLSINPGLIIRHMPNKVGE
jgi:hypothetical protein